MQQDGVAGGIVRGGELAYQHGALVVEPQALLPSAIVGIATKSNAADPLGVEGCKPPPWQAKTRLVLDQLLKQGTGS